MKKIEKNLKIYFFLAIVIFLHFSFGFYHLSKFETTDEHLWKYERIKQYWQAIAEKNWEKTYINDKPGITVALFSGIGLFFERNPEKHLIRDPAINHNGLFLVYDIAKSERINFVFRFPVLILSTFSFLLFYWLIYKAFNSAWLALFSVMFIALNPILLGMSQIVNPDSYFWIFSGLAIFSYFARLNTNEKKFLLLTIIFTGFSFLSKYTALTLFIFYLLALGAKIIFDKFESTTEQRKKLIKGLADIFIIFIFSIFIFSIFLPAVFVNPELLLKGVSQFKGIYNFLLIIFFSLVIYILLKNKPFFFDRILNFISSKRRLFLILVCLFFLIIINSLFINVWSGQKFVPLDNLREEAYANEPKRFNFGNLLEENSYFEKKVKLFLMEVYPFIFSLTPLILFFIFYLIVKSFKNEIDNASALILFSIVLFFIFYFTATVFARIVSNARYSIILYPLFSFLAAVGLWEFVKKNIHKKFFLSEKTMFFISIMLLVCAFFTLWSIRPFYFSYANFLLPQKFTIHHSWGHGFYEAAQYLNSLPESKNIVIWSNTSAICPFLEGRCLKSRKINFNIVQPNYIVISKRGELKKNRAFEFINPPSLEKDSAFYFEKIKNNYEWALFIDNRQENFIKIVKFEY